MTPLDKKTKVVSRMPVEPPPLPKEGKEFSAVLGNVPPGVYNSQEELLEAQLGEYKHLLQQYADQVKELEVVLEQRLSDNAFIKQSHAEELAKREQDHVRTLEEKNSVISDLRENLERLESKFASRDIVLSFHQEESSNPLVLGLSASLAEEEALPASSIKAKETSSLKAIPLPLVPVEPEPEEREGKAKETGSLKAIPLPLVPLESEEREGKAEKTGSLKAIPLPLVPVEPEPEESIGKEGADTSESDSGSRWFSGNWVGVDCLDDWIASVQKEILEERNEALELKHLIARLDVSLSDRNEPVVLETLDQLGRAFYVFQAKNESEASGTFRVAEVLNKIVAERIQRSFPEVSIRLRVPRPKEPTDSRWMVFNPGTRVHNIHNWAVMRGAKIVSMAEVSSM